jgi:glycerophosphoryl diester phosphodiesterase
MRPIEIIAHRGLADHFPENTIPAFKEAVEHGADAVEFDVRLSSDKIPLVYHNYYLHELTNLVGPAFKKTYQQIRAAKFVHQPDPQVDLHIPSLVEVLNHLTGKIILEIEIKAPKPEASGLVGSLLSDYRHAWDSIEITSYEPMHLVDIREYCPGITADLLIPLNEPWMGPDVLTYQVIHRAHLAVACGVHVHPTQLSRHVAEQIRNGGIEVLAWDVNHAADWYEVVRHRIPKITTDNLVQIMRLAGR